jgi:hypothetical protein
MSIEDSKSQDRQTNEDDQQGNLRVSNDYTILPRKKALSVVVSLDEWHFLLDKILNLKNFKNRYLSFGIFLFGLGAGAFYAIITSGNLIKTNIIKFCILLSLTIILFIVGIICMTFSKKCDELERESADGIVKYMKLIENRFLTEKTNP